MKVVTPTPTSTPIIKSRQKKINADRETNDSRMESETSKERNTENHYIYCT